MLYGIVARAIEDCHQPRIEREARADALIVREVAHDRVDAGVDRAAEVHEALNFGWRKHERIRIEQIRRPGNGNPGRAKHGFDEFRAMVAELLGSRPEAKLTGHSVERRHQAREVAHHRGLVLDVLAEQRLEIVGERIDVHRRAVMLDRLDRVAEMLALRRPAMDADPRQAAARLLLVDVEMLLRRNP